MPDTETDAMQLYAAIKRHQALIKDASFGCDDDNEFMSNCAIFDEELYSTAESIINGEYDG